MVVSGMVTIFYGYGVDLELREICEWLLEKAFWSCQVSIWALQTGPGVLSSVSVGRNILECVWQSYLQNQNGGNVT